MKGEWLSQTRISDYGKCPFQYELKWVKKLVKRWTPAPMRRGSLVHKGFEAALRWDWATRHPVISAFMAFYGEPNLPEDWVQNHPERHLEHMLRIGERAIRELQASWLADPVVAPFIDEYMRETAERLTDDAVKIFRRSFAALGVHEGKWKTVTAPNGQPFIEYRMEVPWEGESQRYCEITGNACGTDTWRVGHPCGCSECQKYLNEKWEGIHGTLDWIAEDERGHLWLWDFKTRKSVQPEEYDRLQIQAPVYQDLLRETLGVVLVGTVTYQIRAAVLQRPKMNKTKTKQPDGTSAIGMSRSNVSTDWPTYRLTLLENGLDPDDYLDMKEKLPASFDRIDSYYRGPKELESVRRNNRLVVLNMERSHREGSFPRNISPFTCRGCSHRSYCEADLHDEDVEFLAQTEYMREDETPKPLDVLFEDDSDA